MKRLGLYKHRYNTDVAILVLHWVEAGHGATYKVKLSWWNIISEEKRGWWDMGLQETVYIPKEKWEREWQLIES